MALRRLGLGALSLSACVMLLAIWLPGKGEASSSKQQVTAAEFKKSVSGVVKKYCVNCHSAKSPAGKLSLSGNESVEDVAKSPETWNKVAKRVISRQMPPEGSPQPTDAERTAFTKSIDSLTTVDCKLADVGRVTIRRLNRDEYNRSIRDLLWVDISPADDFPSDDVGEGFDNIGDVLSASPLLVENYLKASEKAIAAAFRFSKTSHSTFDLDSAKITEGAISRDGVVYMYAQSSIVGSFAVESGGAYRLTVKAAGMPAGGENPILRVKSGQQVLANFSVAPPLNKFSSYTVPINLPRGKLSFEVSFVNDFYIAAKADSPAQDRNVAVSGVELYGPVEDKRPSTRFMQWLMPDVPAKANEIESARASLTNFAERAYRRPATSEEVERIMQVFSVTRKAGDDYTRAIANACQAVLCSPNFLFRAELESEKGALKSRTLNGFEIASRLSYFLWSTIPDETLVSLARSGELLKPQILEQQVNRMLVDPKAIALTDNFASQWLQLRKLADFEPDKKLFPSYSRQLENDMLAESNAYFSAVVREDKPISDFLHSEYTYVNQRLADHYAIGGVTSSDFVKVNTRGSHRGGLLTQAAILTVTSNPTRTSPTKRGKWILEQILGTPPPPPPPGVGDLKDDKKITDALSLRKRMEMHRSDPNCASCHTQMDTLGFGFEGFDPIGRIRTTDGNHPVDSGGELPGGKKFKDSDELREILLKRKDDFARTLSEKLMVYGLGRRLTNEDRCTIDEIVTRVKKDQYRFSSIIKGIVTSAPFTRRSTL